MLIKTGKRTAAKQEQANRAFAQQMRGVIEVKAQQAREFKDRLAENNMTKTDYHQDFMRKSKDERSAIAIEQVSKNIHERNQMAGISDVHEVAQRKAVDVAELAEKKKVIK
jgi:hypothetical protein